MNTKRRNRGWLLAGVSIAATITALVAIPAQAQERQVRLAGTANAVPGSYLVVLKDGVSTQDAKGLADRYGGRVGHTYHQALHGFTFVAGDQQARRLAADGAVAFVQQNQKVR